LDVRDPVCFASAVRCRARLGVLAVEEELR
jgi:hypothetical protein